MMSNEYEFELNNSDNATKRVKAKKKVKKEVFSDSKTGIWVVMLSVLVGFWVMLTVAGYDRWVGINWTIYFTIAAVSVAAAMAVDDNLKKDHAVFWLVVIVVISSAFFKMSDFPVLAFLFLPTLIVFFSIYAAKRSTSKVIVTFLYRHFASFIHFWRFFLVRFGADGEGKKSALIKVLLGVAVSFVLLLIIIPLMFSADAIFQSVMENIFDFEDFFDCFFARLFWGFFVTLLTFAFLYTITVKKDVPIEKNESHKKREDMSAMLITVLSVVGITFLMFTLIQAWHLFFRAGGTLPEGYTYMEYAVDGYWNQAWLTAVNLMVVLGALALNRHSSTTCRKVVNALLTLMTTINVYLVFSAAYKMHLYESTYGFTEQRTLVYLILLFELVTLILLVITIFNRKFPFIKTVIYVGAAYFALVACLNLQAFSVSQNIKRYYDTGEIDMYYLTHQAPDASAQKKDFYIENFDTLTEEQKEDLERDFDLRAYTSGTGNTLIYRDLTSYEARYKKDIHWFEFNLSDYREYLAGREILKFLQEQGQ